MPWELGSGEDPRIFRSHCEGVDLTLLKRESPPGWVGWVIETTTSVFLALSPGHPSLEEASCHGTGPLEEAHEARN